MIKFFHFICLVLAIAVSANSVAANEPLKDGKKIDEEVEQALDFYKYSVMVESFKAFEAELEKNGVNLDAVSGRASASRPEFLRILLNLIIHAKSNQEIHEWANQETPDSNYVGGKREFQMVIENGVVRECHTINALIEPHLAALTNDLELRKTVDIETLRYWKIMRACECITSGTENGQLIDDLYQELQRRYKTNSSVKSVLSTIFFPFSG